MAFKGARVAFLGVRNAMRSSIAMKVALLGVLFIPVIFSGFYLSAFFDPYANLDKVAVAVVNQDEGAKIGGEQRNLGDEVCDRLDGEKQRFGWEYVSRKEAQQGLEDGTYYMVCTIPADFSSKVASAQTDSPSAAELGIQYNKAKNMLASQVGATAWAKVEATLNKNIVEEYWATVFDTLRESGYELQDAADGAGELATGLGDAVGGADKVSDGASDAEAGSKKVTDGLVAAKEGSDSLDEGLASAAAGSKTLDAGASDLASGAAVLDEGVSRVVDGAKSLEQGSASLQAGVDAAAAGSEDLLAGAQALQAGISQYTSAVAAALSQAASGTSQLVQAAGAASDSAAGAQQLLASAQRNEDGSYTLDEATYEQIVAYVGTAEGYASQTRQGLEGLNGALGAYAGSGSDSLIAASDQLNAGASGLVSGLETLSSGLGTASAGAAALSEGASSLSAGAQSAQQGSGQLADGALSLSRGMTGLSLGLDAAKDGSATLNDGLGQLQQGSATLTSGLGQLSEGSSSLAAGLVTAEDGASQLQSGLADGAQEMVDNGSNSQVKSAVMSAPVTLRESDYTEVENYGSGFAPFFIGLGIWVGCIFAGFLLKPLNRRLMISGASPVKVAFSGFMPLSLYAIAQGIISVAFVQFGLGVAIDNVPAYYGMSILCCMCFMAIIQFLVAAFGFPGRFIAVVLLTLQLTSAAGTFPVETAPAFFQVISPWMPMTYFVDGMRQIMAGGNMMAVGVDALALVAFMVVAFAATCLYARSKRTVLLSDLHPLLEL